MVRMDGTLSRLFGWPTAAGHKAIMRLFARFDIPTSEPMPFAVRDNVDHPVSLYAATKKANDVFGAGLAQWLGQTEDD